LTFDYFSFKEGIIEKKNPDLEYYYMKKSAELGLVDA
jgi:TPR repeat protein